MGDRTSEVVAQFRETPLGIFIEQMMLLQAAWIMFYMATR